MPRLSRPRRPSARLLTLLLVCVGCCLSARPLSAISLHPGWPQTIGSVYGSPSLGDLDGAGSLEVVVGSGDGYVYAWHADGASVSGWPQGAGSGGVVGSTALADLDGDGSLEVVVGSSDFKVYAWHADGSPVAGWPQTTSGFVYSSPAVGDLDGDGRLEVVVGGYDGKVYAWHADGSPVAGWPQTTGGPVNGSPALGDLNGDGSLEVVVGGWDSKVYAWRADGASVAGWPQTTGGPVYSSPALGDLDGDGRLEVVVGSHDSRVYAWHADGTAVTGWPQATGDIVQSSPALGDMDGDGGLEVVVGSYDFKVYAWHADGTAVTGWPQATGDMVQSSPALGDLDGDGHLEVVVGSVDGKVYAWHADGASVTDWPQSAGSGGDTSPPAVGDLDGDGRLEVVVGTFGGKVYAWTCTDTTGDTLPWPKFHHDLLSTGRYGGYVDFGASPRSGAAPLAVTFTDWSIQAISWSWDFGDGNTSTAAHPTHTYASGGTYDVTLTVTYSGGGTDTRTKAGYIVVNAGELSVSASASPATVASGGTAVLSASAVDALGHGIASWSWSDGGAGGTFSPSPEVQNPTYTAPANATDGVLTLTLTVTATCDGPSPVTESGSTTLTVSPRSEYTLSLTGTGSGAVRVNGVTHTLPWASSFAAHSSVSLEAVPGTGWSFVSWSGDLSGSASPATITMDADKDVAATFALPPGVIYNFPLDDPATELAGWTGLGGAPGTGWEYGAPVAGGGQPLGEGGAMVGGDPASAHTGANVLGYVIGGNYQRGLSPQYLTTRPLDFTARSNVRLRFWRWLGVEDQAYDTAAIEVNAGDGWQRVWTNPTGSPPIYTFDGQWTEVEYPLPQADGKAAVQVRWQMGGSDAFTTPTEYGGWSLDDISFVCSIDSWRMSEGDLPESLTWDQQADFSLVLDNTGETTWNESYSLLSASPNDCWGTDSLALTGQVAPGGSYTFTGQLTAPPLTTLAYSPLPVDAASPGVEARLACDWQLSQAQLGRIGTADGAEIPISRFADIAPGTDGAWARFWVEELAGNVPLVVSGYPNGSYEPQGEVDRASIAVYVTRAAKLDITPASGTVFQDVPADQWAADWIEVAQANGIVTGYADGSYRPDALVDRAEMCKFTAKGRALVDPSFIVPASVAEPPFPDVPTTSSLAPFVAACADADIVEGYPNGNFEPALTLTRDQLAVFVWRGLIRDYNSAVVLGGPGTTATDVSRATAAGFASTVTSTAGDAAFAYVTLDVLRLNPGEPLSVVFEFRSAATPTDPVASLPATVPNLVTAKTAAQASGVPYLTCYAELSELPPGDYVMSTVIDGESLKRTARLTVTAPTP